MPNDSTIAQCQICKGDINVGEEHVCNKLSETNILNAQNKLENLMTEPLKHAGGRPLKFKTHEELEAKINEYFNKTPKEEWTITGLALALDTSRKVLVEYEDKDEFSNTVKKAKLIVENGYEIDLKKHGRSGTIFALKNFDWKDKTEQDINLSGADKLGSMFDKAKKLDE